MIRARGSPPRARGTLALVYAVVVAIWITPACAGNTERVAELGQVGQDHPRVRGEHPRRIGRIVCSAGSPPRARGTLFLTCDFIGRYPGFHLTSSRFACNLRLG